MNDDIYDDVYVDGIDYGISAIEECSSLSKCNCSTMKYHVRNKHILHEDDWECYPCTCDSTAYAFIVYRSGIYRNGWIVRLCIQHLYFKNNIYFEELNESEIIYHENIDKYVERYKRLKNLL